MELNKVRLESSVFAAGVRGARTDVDGHKHKHVSERSGECRGGLWVLTTTIAGKVGIADHCRGWSARTARAAVGAIDD